jgi:2-methylisocitrate lyase-like PEP mutase family enzyme
MRLAMPDMDLLTFPEMRDAVETMVSAAPDVLWLADGDTGYGNSIAVQKTIRQYARAGAAAVLIEDKQWPRHLGHNGAKLVVDREEARLRCRVAVQAAKEEGILLLARTDARTSRGFEEAHARLTDFVEEGADIFFLDSPASEEEMRASVEACKGKPAIAVTNPGGKHFKPEDGILAAIGIKMVIYPQEILASTVLAIRAALQGLKTGQRAPMAEASDLAAAIRSPDYLSLDARLAKGGQSRVVRDEII